jgi:hypothetical protein
VKLRPVSIAGVDESAQLSLSNPIDINRGVATHEMAVSIIEEYRRRRSETDAFAEWFSIDPPFPDGVFGDEKLVGGAYVNGGIMPLVGGELAKAAFDHGFEEYGVDILRRYYMLVSEKEETYLWYFPDGTPASVETSTSPEAEPTDGWGSSAMLYALIAGLAGIDDAGACFEEVRLAPRWPAARVDQAEVRTAYEATGCRFGYTYRLRSKGIELVVHAPGSIVHFHVLIPADASPRSVSAAGDELHYRPVQIEKSRYLDFATRVRGEVKVEIDFS